MRDDQQVARSRRGAVAAVAVIAVLGGAVLMVTLVASRALSAPSWWPVALGGRRTIERDGGLRMICRGDVAAARAERAAQGQAVDEEALWRETVEVLRARLGRVAPDGVVRRAGDRVIIDLPRPEQEVVEQVHRVLLRRGRLEFKLVDRGNPLMAKLAALARGRDGITVDRDRYRAPATATADTGAGDGTGEESFLTGTRAALDDFFAHLPAEAAIPADRQIAYEPLRSWESPAGAPDGRLRTYLLFRRTELGNEHIADAELRFDPTTLRPDVTVTFDAAGARAFGELTARSIGRQLAIVLDGRIESAPVIQSRIGGGRAQITVGSGDPARQLQEARDLAAILRVGALPMPLELTTMDQVAPGGRTR